ncbi:RNA polymerase sigma-70 factor (ECF subfamily) [Crossiella equi]|uniref:RNA polymerase sigma-70 factor (ECF subfamily) n=1 Tax=Crossiella equi TaxID=130796 RepID=A0ABS5AQS9_9PSEU|nr:RNA polymerase sigma factor [Crossiella equi]MBP2478928.1 RNA polymerase sigma-70 factor (ECF subfamily) [Crossiella equi]
MKADEQWALLAELRPRVLHICARLLPTPEDAEDAAQEALLVIADGLSTRPPEVSLRGWVYGQVVNVARLRHRQLERQAEDQVPAQSCDAVADPRRTSGIAGTRQDLLRALERLREGYPLLAQALVYRDVCALGYTEIAEALGISETTVKSRIHDARKRMREQLAG